MDLHVLAAGSGGQGILFLGKLIAAAGMREGFEVTWFPSYGAEMRGGTAHCTVIISDSLIGSPVVRDLHVLLAMNEAARLRFAGRLLPGGLLIHDASDGDAGRLPHGVRSVSVPAIGLAAAYHDARYANMVMMGAFVGLTDLLSLDTVMESLREAAHGRRGDAVARNEELLRKGYALFNDTQGDHSGR
jgi:2-oxoglutarate ferredoxin oxidoreductase subunit gamma